MAGSGASSGFDATQFRDAIHFAMNMGAPNEVSNQVTFVFSEARSYLPEDPNRDPYDWGETPATDVAQRTVVVPAAVVFATGTALEGSPVGEFNANTGTLTLLDVDYAAVKGADSVIISGSHYVISPPGWVEMGLFDVSVWQANVRARG